MVSELQHVGRLYHHHLVRMTSFIHVGKITDRWSYWTPDSTEIFTDGILEVTETIYGPPKDTVIVTVMGGQVGNMAVGVSDAPTIEVGQEGIALLHVFSSGSAYWHGATVFTVFGIMRANPELLEHMRYLVNGYEVPPVRVGSTDFRDPISGPVSAVGNITWGQIKRGR